MTDRDRPGRGGQLPPDDRSPQPADGPDRDPGGSDAGPPGWLRDRFSDSTSALPPFGRPPLDELRIRARRRSRRRTGLAAAGTLGTAAAIAAFLALVPGARSSNVAVTSPATSLQGRGPAAVTTPTAGTVPTTGASGTGSTHPPACRPGQLSLSERRYPQPAGGYIAYGLGHSAAVVLFDNESSETCELTGYPKVAGLDRAGATATEATPTPGGYLGGLPLSDTKLPVVTLRPGATASAMVEGTDNPQAAAASCPSLAGLAVTAPDGTAPVRLPAAPGDCSGLEVHPVVPGDTGTDRG